MAAFEVEIEKMVAGGDGLARHDGRVVFVPATAPGEVHRVRAVARTKDYIRAESLACLEPSAARREPPCPYFGQCGGCSMMHIEPTAQLEVKRQIAAESFVRAGLRDVGNPGATPSPEAAYRTRLRFHVARTDEGTRLGFRRRSSHDVVEVERCLLASDTLNRVWARVRDWVRADPARSRGLTSIELQESSHDLGRIVGRFLVRSRDGIRRFESRGPEELVQEGGLDGLLVEAPGRDDGLRRGRPEVHHTVGGLSFRQSAGSFFQANRFLLGPLVDAAAPPSPVARLVDLYAGVGLFSLSLAGRAGAVLGVESSRRAILDARANARSGGIEHARFVHADVRAFARRRRRLSGSDYVLLDPPRGGLPKALRKALAESPVRAFSYVSCDPPALARDQAFLSEHGFRVAALELVDLFPNTHHFEVVVRCERTSRP